MLTEKFQATAKNIFTHRKKLICLWLREHRKSLDCVKNFSRNLTIEEDDLQFGLDNHILPKKL